MTYNGNPASSVLDQVRLLIGDTSNDASRELLTDNEINFFVNQYNSDAVLCAIAACEALATRFAKDVDFTLGGMSSQGSERARLYMEMADHLRVKANTRCEFFAGGRTYSGNSDLLEDSDKIPPRFGIGMDDHP